MERWKDIAALFEAALEVPPEARGAWLEETCADPDLRREVQQMLAAHQRAQGILDAPPPTLPKGLAAERAEEQAEAYHLGPYRLLRELGRGGMGRVYLAERDDEQFTRQVAVKVLRREIDTDDHIGRFLAERQILASLSHPNIARLYEGGVTEDGRPYFVMERVEGRPIDRYCDDNQLTVEERLRLFMVVGEAVQYAHRNLVVHRDLKPSNILVTKEGQVKLLDFGIAKLLDAEAMGLLQAAPVTHTGMHLMTPEYAAPEQVCGEPITTASDVYQLGVVLYELLTGRRPYHVAGRTPSEVERVICEEHPLPPSAAVALDEKARGEEGRDPSPPEVVSRIRRTMPSRLRRALRGDLDMIVLKALRKEPERRYASAEALVEDLDRHLRGRPVEARPDTWRYRGRMFVRRHRWGVAAAAVILLLLVGYAVTLTLQKRQVRAALAQVRIEAEKAEQVSAFLMDLFEASDPGEALGDTVTARALLARGEERTDALAEQPEVQAQMLNVIGRVYRRLGRYDRAQPLLEQSLALRRALYGAEHPDVAQSLDDLAFVLERKGALDTAEVLYRQSLAMRRRLLGDEHTDVAASLDHLASVLHEQGDYDEAERLLREALSMRRRLLGVEHTSLAVSLNNLGNLLQDMGEYDGAERLLREALAMRRKLLGDEHPDVATDLISLALLLQRKGAYEESEALNREGLAMYRKLLGDEHPYVAASLNNLAALLYRKGDYGAAEPLYREALARYRAILGDEHPHLAIILNNLAVVLKKQQDYAAAESLYRQSLAMRRRLLGDEHPQVATTLNNLGELLHRTGDLDAAQRHYREALAIRRDQLGPAHPNVANCLNNLGNLSADLGEFLKAERLLLEALEIQYASLGHNHPRVEQSLEDLISLYEAWGKHEQADAYRVRLAEVAAEKGR